MIVRRTYEDILANLSRNQPLDLDRIISGEQRTGRASDLQPSSLPPAAALWDMSEDGPSRIGVRIKAPVQDAELLAARLAAIAVERDIHPVFLSYIARSGMQRFGFRVEQLSGLTEQAQQCFEDQLTRFWRLALIVDAEEIKRLG
jgi:hypothetical protein